MSFENYFMDFMRKVTKNNPILALYIVYNLV